MSLLTVQQLTSMQNSCTPASFFMLLGVCATGYLVSDDVAQCLYEQGSSEGKILPGAEDRPA
jgi:hypothetical protein